MTETDVRAAVPDTTWVVCTACGDMIYAKRLGRNLQVCPNCGHHKPLTAHERIHQLFDEPGAELLDVPSASEDVLGFVDTVAYPARLAAARASTGLDEGVVLARGTIEGTALVAAVMDFRFLGGSLGAAVGELITRAAEIALDERVPLLIVSASGGARMQEGALSLMQMAKTAQALGRLDEAGVLTLSLITDPTYGGVAASFSTLCDVIVAEPGARLGFAGRRVIEQTIRQELPPGFQTAEFLLECGLIDGIRPRAELRTMLGRLLRAGVPRAPETERAGDPETVVRTQAELPVLDAWEQVWRARDIGRPTTLDYLQRAFTDFEELRGDRLGGDCPALVGGIARLDDMQVVVLGHQKGRTISEITLRNNGMPSPAGYRKTARLMRLAAKLDLPVVTLVDTPGAYPGSTAEQQGQAVAIAENIRLMAGLPVPVVTLVTGEGGSGGALALAVANEVLIVANGVYSVISPEGCAAILWKDPARASDAARALRVDARQLLGQGIVDGVVPEPDGGNQADHDAAASAAGRALAAALRRLSALGRAELVERRRARYRAFGALTPTTARRGT